MKNPVRFLWELGIRLLGKEKFLYLFFGVLTTLVNFVVYLVCSKLGASTAFSTVMANVLAILFAYVTNRKWVFESTAHTAKEIASEMGKFFAARAGTFVLDLVFMVVLVDVLHLHELVCKVGVNVLVIVLNYVASKIFVFK